LQPLAGPANDLKALADILRDPDRGQFQVRVFLDKASYEILPDIVTTARSAA
jgi:hypothetical protein